MKEQFKIYFLDNTYANDSGRESRHTNLEEVSLRDEVPFFESYLDAKSWLNLKVFKGVLSKEDKYVILPVISFE